ncbi:carbohydrate kinase family protein [Lentzea sp.]|uniref:carbohydrate kinase family protein n=1 Tax=Lentzea sp. TaxID=56099 RepID=UPI002C91A35C|nr:PfkB family carbohydrate kinase [Lentzea sp.]HUQ55109.1 PfkB family carbohydrate kinase [Lentzea sp.]
MDEIVAVGQMARDLVLVVDEVPGPGDTTPVRERREMLGGKGANIAVGLAQLGAPVALVGVVGDDDVGARLIARAAADGIATEAVVRRPDTETGLIVDLVADGWRYLGHLPDAVRLREDDLPIDLITRAAAEPLSGRTIKTANDAVEAAREVRALGPNLVAFAVDDVGDVGDVFAGDSGQLVVPPGDVEVVDTTGRGDAFVAALTFSLTRGDGPEEAARRAVEASGDTVSHLGGRPTLTAR